MTKLTRYLVKVAGSLPFPIDMLRYDLCTPYAESDSEKIARSFEPESGLLEIWVRHDTTEKRWRPTVDRWASRGWQVINIREGGP